MKILRNKTYCDLMQYKMTSKALYHSDFKDLSFNDLNFILLNYRLDNETIKKVVDHMKILEKSAGIWYRNSQY